MAKRKIEVVEKIIAKDLCSRGIGPLVQLGSLYNAARDLQKATHVGIATGFFIHSTECPENDGPSGALAIAKACLVAGKDVTLITDKHFPREALNSAISAANISSSSTLSFFDFPSSPPTVTTSSSTSDWEFFAEQTFKSKRWDYLVAIERVGPSHDGRHYNMRGGVISEWTPPMEVIFEHALALGVPTCGIGDGGNEIGMGNVLDLVREHIPRGDTIACVIKASHLITAGISNWGGHALATALCLLMEEEKEEEEFGKSLTTDMLLDGIGEEAVLRTLMEAGIVDGVKGMPSMSVDGLEFDDYMAVLEECWRI